MDPDEICAQCTYAASGCNCRFQADLIGAHIDDCLGFMQKPKEEKKILEALAC